MPASRPPAGTSTCETAAPGSAAPSSSTPPKQGAPPAQTAPPRPSKNPPGTSDALASLVQANKAHAATRATFRGSDLEPRVAGVEASFVRVEDTFGLGTAHTFAATSAETGIEVGAPLGSAALLLLAGTMLMVGRRSVNGRVAAALFARAGALIILHPPPKGRIGRCWPVAG